ncbi:uncharacterized protein LOC127851245 [Dreissena polymorpha]|uniref:Uncharacterized protein n=1 Tax=Dreissena polymorpha TaxID=45954 RepID=A0A9D4HVP0_DREPO|nr:uncharacterized protein LOC127851245 [Dreissena polymorpha]KAH3734529.1 hypothetical protein DPMN_040968 [Dreissena polymorpha]
MSEQDIIDEDVEHFMMVIRDATEAFRFEIDKHSVFREMQSLGYDIREDMIEIRFVTTPYEETQIILIALFRLFGLSNFWFIARLSLPREILTYILIRCVHPRVLQIPLRRIPSSRLLATLYCSLKQKLDNNALSTIEMRIFVLNRRLRLETNITQWNVDIYVVSVALTVQLLNEFRQKKSYLRTMQRHINGLSVRGIDITFAKVVYNGYRAYFASKHPERAQLARNILTEIAVTVHMYAGPLLRLAYYIFYHYSYRWLCCGRARAGNHSDYATDSEIESSVQMFERAAIGVMSEFENNNAVKQFVRCWSFVNTVQCYLMITDHFVINTDHEIGRKSVAMAKKYLNMLQTNLAGLVKRHKIKYYLCKARVCECEGDLELALLYVIDVVRLAPAGTLCTDEIDNIDKYHTFILRWCLPIPDII